MPFGICKQDNESFNTDSPNGKANYDQHRIDHPGHIIEWDVKVDEKIQASTGFGGGAGPQKVGKPVGFKPLVEQWNYYETDAGEVVGVKLVVTKLFATGRFGVDGNEAYAASSINAITVYSKEEFDAVKKAMVSLR